MTTLTEAPLNDADGLLPSKRKSSGGGLGTYILIRFLLIIPDDLHPGDLVFFLMRVTGDPITAALGGRLPPDAARAAHPRGRLRPPDPRAVPRVPRPGRAPATSAPRITDRRPVVEVLTTFGAATLELAFYALIVALLVGIPLGLIAAYRRDKGPDAVLRVFAILCYATPVFFAGLLLKLVFSVWLGWLPVAGRASTSDRDPAMRRLPHRPGIY